MSIKSIPILLSACVFFILACQTETKDCLNNPASADPLTILMDGNLRFVESHSVHPNQSLEKIKELKQGQHPIAVVITCADSRVPPELIFDQGFGDIFTIRNAGNIIGDYELGSVEYAIEHLHTSLIMVLGHKKCGAIHAYLDHKTDTLHNHIQSIIDYIKVEEEEMKLDTNLTNYEDLAIKANIIHGVKLLRNSNPVLSDCVQKGKLKIIGALYDIETGKVELLDI